MANHHVFVYGTLKRGEPNHDWISTTTNGYAKFIGKAETVKKYPLVIASQYNIPFLLDKPGLGENVCGEVYEIDNKMLLKLDELEDHPNFYIREIENVKCGDQILGCWIYLLKKYRESLLSEEYLKDYSSTGSHGKIYTPSADQSSPADVL